MTDSRQFLFVYGTLRSGLVPAQLRPLVDRLVPVGAGRLAGRLYDLGTYPGAVVDSASTELVHGEVLELPDDARVLARLDAYEGFDPRNVKASLFLRLRAPVQMAGGQRLDCWVYSYNRDPAGLPLIPGGDYAAWST